MVRLPDPRHRRNFSGLTQLRDLVVENQHQAAVLEAPPRGFRGWCDYERKPDAAAQKVFDVPRIFSPDACDLPEPGRVQDSSPRSGLVWIARERALHSNKIVHNTELFPVLPDNYRAVPSGLNRSWFLKVSSAAIYRDWTAR